MKKIKHTEQSEEIRDIIEKIPTGFTTKLIMLITGITTLTLLFGWIIKYPDVVKGQIIINTSFSPVRLTAPSYGKLILLNITPQKATKEGQNLAYIQNAANYESMIETDSLLKLFDTNEKTFIRYRSFYKPNVQLGEVEPSYFSFLNALQNIIAYYQNNSIEKEIMRLNTLSSYNTSLLHETQADEMTKRNNLELTRKAYKRDSILHSQKVLADADIERSKQNLLANISAYQSINKDILNYSYQIGETDNKLQQLLIEKSNKEQQLKLDVLSTYHNLIAKINDWQQRYVLKSPFDGKVEFVKFWTTNQFVQSGEEVFTIIPSSTALNGQVTLPEHGSGKVAQDQTAMIKLDNYPYKEYGYVKGQVQSISLISNQLLSTANNSKQSSLLLTIALPDGLKTNYGSSLPFKYELKGEAEIITKDRRLLERLFDNLKYTVSK